MKKPFIVWFATLIVSTVASAYILSQSISLESYRISTFILSFALFLMVTLHISTATVLKPNALWTVTRTLIIPEVISTWLLLIWKPIAAFAEIGIASLVIL